MTPTSIRFLWEQPEVLRDHRTAVSLHSHTRCSREGLGFLPRWLNDVPVLSWELNRLIRRCEVRTGGSPDFSAAYWTPPLRSWEAFGLERRALEDGLGVYGLVSLTDHDTIAAGCEVKAHEPAAPVSVEWTVPFRDTFFHLGVHNLLERGADVMMAALATYTSQPTEAVLRDLLACLHAEREVLIVLNHPLWDQAGIGVDRHMIVLRRFLTVAGGTIHAMELNGLRPWEENRMVAHLAGELGRPVISGGDRHGCEPNAVVNLTRARTFAEFADEVRSGVSDVLFLPAYREPLTLRIMQTLFDILHYRESGVDGGRWTDRVFYAGRDGQFVALSSVWASGGPAAVRWFVRGVELSGHQSIQRPLRRVGTFLTGRQCSILPSPSVAATSS